MWGTPTGDLAFLDAPPARALSDAHNLLVELGAIDADHHVTPTGRAMAELPVHPRLARMIIAAAERGLGGLACTMAAMLEERDIMRGRPEVVPVSIADRLRAIVDPRSAHPAVDRNAVQLVRRRSGDLRRRSRNDDAEPTEEDLAACGPLLAHAYPDRVAQARGDGRFRLRSGAAARLPAGDSLTGEQFLVVADLDAPRIGRSSPRGRGAPGDDDLRIRLAAGIDEADVGKAAAGVIEEVVTTRWDTTRDDLRQRHERRLGALVLESREGRALPGEETTATLVEHVRSTQLVALRWRESDRALQARVGFARRSLGGEWPDMSDEALLGSLDDWLAPRLVGATGRADLERIDLGRVLRDAVGHHRIPELDRLVPTTLVLPGGSSVPVDYSGEQPSIAARVQALYGITVHPVVADGRVPLVVHLLSPAGRPVQVTSDLPGFWAGSWNEVRKDMAGRYPKHDWPQDPSVAPSGRRRGR